MLGIRVKSFTSVMLVAAAASLSACKSDSDSAGGAEGTLETHGGQPQSNTIAKTAIDDGILHVWPQATADRVFFDTDKSVIKPEGRDVLTKWVAFLAGHPRDQLLIEGHSDERGTREYNLALGERRASAIKEFLVMNGVQAERIKLVSYGKERPAVIGSNDDAYAQNRRAVGILQ